MPARFSETQNLLYWMSRIQTLTLQGDAALTKALFHAKKNKITVVTITQRPALLNCVDKIMVLNNGSVTMFGTRATVMEALKKNKQPGSVPSISAAE